MTISQSGLALFKTCRKAYELGYVRNLSPMVTNDAAENGTTIHKYLEQAARGLLESNEDPLLAVVSDYLRYKPLPGKSLFVGAEDPYYVQLLPDVNVRCTFDLVYLRGTTVVIRDYKSFTKAPTLDLDLDFQSRFYIAAAMKYFKTTDVQFEFEYIRQELGRTLKEGYKEWTTEERYMNYPLVISKREAAVVWQDAKWLAEDLLDAMRKGSWYHQDRKGWGGCQSCFYKNLCKAENQLGTLDDQTIALLATYREPMKELPNERSF